MAEEGFRLPGSSYEELTKIIKGYSSHNGPAVPEDIKKLTGIHPTIVSRNNAFLVGIDILTEGRKKVITEKGKALARALEHEMPDEITNHWQGIVINNEFFGKILAAVRIRKGMEE